MDRGLGKVLLQHASRSVPDMPYLIANDELREAVFEMRMLIGYKSGPRMADRVEEKARDE